jgi:hypothetical protein
MLSAVRHKKAGDEEIMIIIRVMGGLGNQLQQYALYRKYESMGVEARLDMSWFAADVQANMASSRKQELDRFVSLPMKIASKDEIRAVLGRQFDEPETLFGKLQRRIVPRSAPFFTETKMYHPEIFGWKQKYLAGYWACDKYYADIMPQLRESIRFPESGDERNRKLMQEMEKCESVSMHIRRGDYLDAANAALFGNICTEKYYDSAVTFIKERFPGAVFYLFSDDVTYVREHFRGEEYHVVDWNRGEDSFYDMMLMSRCRHNICANSTFSFWGARLNRHPDKVVIRPSVHKNTQVCIPEEMKELWKGWTLISPGGEIVVY